MIDLTIAPEFQAKIPGVAVGWISAAVHNSQHDEALWREIEAAASPIPWHDDGRCPQVPADQGPAGRLSDLGNDPTRYRGSNEALVRRISRVRGFTGSTRSWTSTT